MRQGLKIRSPDSFCAVRRRCGTSLPLHGAVRAAAARTIHNYFLSARFLPSPLPLPHVFRTVPASSPSLGVDGMVYVKDRNQPSLPTPFLSVLVPFSAAIALSAVFHSINSPDNSPLSRSVLPVLLLPYWSFQLYILYESLPQP